MKIFILVEGGIVQAVYADDKNVEVEIIDLDEPDDEEAADLVIKRADEIQATYVEVG